MDSNYGEFQGTEMDPGADYQSDFAEIDEFDDFDWEDENDLVPILAASAALAAVVGGALVLLGRRRKPTTEERIADIVETLEKRGKKGVEMLEKRGKKGVEMLEKRGKKGVEAVTEAVSSAHLADRLEEAIKKAGDLAGSAGDVVSDGSMRSMLEDAVERTRKAASRLDLADTAGDVTKQVRKEVRKGLKKAGKAARNVDIDRKSTEQFLESLQKRVATAIEAVREDYAPKAAQAIRSDVMPAVEHAAGTVRDTVSEQVMPAAQDVLERVQKDVLPAVEKRASRLDDQFHISDRARTAARMAQERGGSLGRYAACGRVGCPREGNGRRAAAGEEGRHVGSDRGPRRRAARRPAPGRRSSTRAKGRRAAEGRRSRVAHPGGTGRPAGSRPRQGIRGHGARRARCRGRRRVRGAPCPGRYRACPQAGR
jgi:hypothetical protein